MSPRMRWIAAASLVLAAPFAGAAEPRAARELVAQRLVAAIDASDGNAVQKDFSSEMRKFLPPEKAAAFFRDLGENHGLLKTLENPRTDPQGQVLYRGRFERGTLDVSIAFDRDDKIAGLHFQPHRDELPVPERNSTALSLPFHDLWLVFWGGDTAEINHHHDTPNQRFAFDLLGTDEDGRTHRGDGAVNEDYFCFGREILAPADGEVTQAIEGVADNRPGSMNPYSALGNAVVIRHGELEVSVLAHLKQGSVRVKAGDKVRRGQVVRRTQHRPLHIRSRRRGVARAYPRRTAQALAALAFFTDPLLLPLHSRSR